MDPSRIPRAIDAAIATARELDHRVEQAAVIHDSDRIAVRLSPCDVLARIGLVSQADSFQFEAEMARRLAEAGSPVGELDPRAGPTVFTRDGFALTLWTYYEPAEDIAPADYADALIRFHEGLRQIDVPAPHISDRIAGWAEELRDRSRNPALPATERQFLSSTLGEVCDAIRRCHTAEQLLHGEPHPGNVLGTGSGPRFIDLHTCQRGPIEYDIAFLPEAAAAHYPGADRSLVRQFRTLMWLGFTTMRWRESDQFPDRDRWRAEGMRHLRATLARG